MAKVGYTLRVDEGDLEKFKSVCETEFNRDPQDTLRELIKAFAECRVTITPTEEQLKERSQLYHESGK